MPAYRVEIEKTGCQHCEAGRMWDVIGPDEMALGISYSLKEDADDMAEYMNMAYERGQASGYRELPHKRQKQIEEDYRRILQAEHDRPEPSIQVVRLTALPKAYQAMEIIDIQRGPEVIKVVVA